MVKLAAILFSASVATLIGVIAYALWWNAHFSCSQYHPF